MIETIKMDNIGYPAMEDLPDAEAL